jgi:hypothetical protein
MAGEKKTGAAGMSLSVPAKSLTPGRLPGYCVTGCCGGVFGLAR